jgi:TolB-like protein/cytochrome c-type biogenesis protein CcmH/NrfG
MPLDLPSTSTLEKIAQILALELITPSETPDDSQALEALTRIVQNADAFKGALATGKLTRLHIPNGLALVFAATPDAPVRCAIQISKALRNHPELKVRMGIYRGPVGDVTGPDPTPDTGGPGLAVARRVMECGDAGHILLTRQVAESLAFYRHWQPHLQHLGQYQMKEGGMLSLVNLYTGEVGQMEMPTKLATLPIADVDSPVDTVPIYRRPDLLVAGALVILLGAYFLQSVFNQRPPAATAEVRAIISPKSIAVLPFENISGTSETASFTEGVHDEILTDLSKLSDLKVISRTSVLPYKTKQARNLREIGRELGVAHVLEGSVQEAGDRVRVIVQLIDARTDTHLWAQTYDRVLSDVFAIQTEIAKTITEQLRVQLSPRERAALAQAATTDLVADRLFRDGLQRLTPGSNPDAKQSLLASIPLLEEAVERDPKFMRAYILLATAQLDLYWQGFDHTPARLEAARKVIERMTTADPTAGETHFAQALYQYRAFRDYDRARAELEQARTTQPNNSGIYIITGAMDRRQGRWNEALRNLSRGIELDPRNFRFLLEGGFTYQAVRNYPQASVLYQRALEVNPRDPFARTQLAALPYLERGDLTPLRTEIARILKDDPTAATAIAGAIYHSALAEHDAGGVARALQAIRSEGLRDDYNNSLWSRDWFVGLAARTFGRDDIARPAFESARQIELTNVSEQPDYAPAWSRLGLIEAALGNKDAAVRAARKACQLLPITTDAFDGAALRTNLALTYLWVGEKDLALSELAEVVKRPGTISYGELLRHPYWEKLRDDKRFQAIIASLAPPLSKAKD